MTVPSTKRDAVRSLLGDRVVRLVFLTRAMTTASAPITLYLVAALRPAAEQGFYFVFTNLQAVAVLFEFGIGTMLVQYAAHATSSLRWTDRGDFVGPETAMNEAAAVLQYARRWFARAAGVVVAVVLPAGLLLFRANTTHARVHFSAPWIVATIGLGAYLTVVPVLCFLEGSGRLRNVQRMRLLQAIVSIACLWTFIPTIGSLNAVALSSVASLVVAYLWLRRFSPALAERVLSDLRAPAGWSAEGEAMLVAQRRTAVAWTIAFLGPQLLAPIVFWQNGPEAAGRLGLTLAAASAPLMLAVAWLHARYPEYGGFAARQNLTELDATAVRATTQAATVFAGATFGLFVFVQLIKRLSPQLFARFLPLPGLAALCASSFAYLLYQAMSAHLRAHREESLYWPVIVGSIVAIAVAIVGARQDVMSATMAYSSAVLFVFLPLAMVVFLRRHRALRNGR